MCAPEHQSQYLELPNAAGGFDKPSTRNRPEVSSTVGLFTFPHCLGHHDAIGGCAHLLLLSCNSVECVLPPPVHVGRLSHRRLPSCGTPEGSTRMKLTYACR